MGKGEGDGGRRDRQFPERRELLDGFGGGGAGGGGVHAGFQRIRERERPVPLSEVYEEDIRGGRGGERVGDGGGAEVGGVNGEGGEEGGRGWGVEGEYT